jgi:choline dehydrogenase-like flavoprotein
VRANARGFFHPIGTCAIGAVVDGDGRVHGCEGLSVADASIMPSIPRANTNLSTIAVAERLAERMLAG